MKKVLFLMLVALLCIPANAQRKTYQGPKKTAAAKVQRKAAPVQRKAAPVQKKQKDNFWNTIDRENFNLIQVGYMRDSYVGNGAFIGYKHGWNITGQKLPLYIEPGVEFHYTSLNTGYNSIGLSAPIDFSYKFKAGDFSISPITGPTLGWNHDWMTAAPSYDCFVFGWDFGGRIAYKKITLEYRYNKTINTPSDGTWNYHTLGLGILF